MQFTRFVRTIGAAATVFASPVFAPAFAQGGPQSSVVDLTRVRSTLDTIDVEKPEYSFESKADSLSWVRSKAVAEKAKGFHIVVSLQDRHLWAIIGQDTVLSAPVAVAKGTTLTFGKRAWTFKTPRGVRTVLRKEADPIWQPPEWLYAETAKEYGLKLGHVTTKSRIKLAGGGILTVRDGQAGVIQNGVFDTLPTDEHIVFGDTLYVPPLGSKNRKVEGELGKFRLDMGEGFLLHGTPYKESIGMAATHGCVRMRDEDIEWLYDHIPVGTKVYIY
jgi:hypothetical protein